MKAAIVLFTYIFSIYGKKYFISLVVLLFEIFLFEKFSFQWLFNNFNRILHNVVMKTSFFYDIFRFIKKIEQIQEKFNKMHCIRTERTYKNISNRNFIFRRIFFYDDKNIAGCIKQNFIALILILIQPNWFMILIM